MGHHTIWLRRGDTLSGLTFTFTDSAGAAISVFSARAQVRANNVNADLLHTFTCLVSGPDNNIVSLSTIGVVASAGFQTGTHAWDLELTLADGRVRTWIGGDFVVSGDITR
jgi:hypothetical protein